MNKFTHGEVYKKTINWLKRGVNPKFLKLIDRFNFWMFTVTYIKVYILR